MATDITWVYPPRWDGTLPTRAGLNKCVVHLIATSETVGETDTSVVALTNLYGSNGNRAKKLAVDCIDYDVGGFSEAYLYFDDAYATPIASLSGIGKMRFPGGVTQPDDMDWDTLVDWTGDIKMTTTILAGLTGSYSIRIYFRVKD